MQNISKTLVIAALVSALGFGPQTLAADNCATSYYCYGNSSAHVSNTPTHPAPLPPPNTNNIRQRNQAQYAARNPQVRPAAMQRPVVHQAVRPRVTPVSAGRVTVRAIPSSRAHPPSRLAPHLQPQANACHISRQRILTRAAELERLAVLNAKHGQRQHSVTLFRDAGKMRNNAQRMHCG